MERLLSRNLTASATFLFARGVRLSRTRNVNLPPPVILTQENAVSLGIPKPFPQQLGMLVFSPERPEPQFDNIYQWENHASSVYDGLSLSLSRRLSNEIELSGSYTLSKAIDDASDFDQQPKNPYLLQPNELYPPTTRGIGLYSAGLSISRSEMRTRAKSLPGQSPSCSEILKWLLF